MHLHSWACALGTRGRNWEDPWQIEPDGNNGCLHECAHPCVNTHLQLVCVSEVTCTWVSMLVCLSTCRCQVHACLWALIGCGLAHLYNYPSTCRAAILSGMCPHCKAWFSGVTQEILIVLVNNKDRLLLIITISIMNRENKAFLDSMKK